ncbi:glycosyltransferase family 4 protein [Laspinema sp. A4]|uniref:glycosyltransferase family 4 protein n=1 Tax=Laspinema sp. D2d TaxID=2953686 RepID=UPI0021BB8DD2|nr:glycosyltransferase family 4 protein [Laspinema sp. D2d]MCT7981991.1 glycosyltransferase family 4 protein [Laspinema sp. D2d]
MKPIKILHIIQSLGIGGAALSMMATAKYSSESGQFKHSVISLAPGMPDALEKVTKAGMMVINAPDRETLVQEIETADIVQIHFWNNPQLYEFLRSPLPEMRLLMWFHIAGDRPPQVITEKLVGFSDFAIACNPYSYELPVFHSLPTEVRLHKIGMVYDGTDFERLSNLQPQPHDSFNVGYIGTVNLAKMHPNYVPMSAAINIPNVRFIVCGGPFQSYFKQQAGLLGAADRFEFRGFVEDIKSVLENLDIYGYPVGEDTYAAAELNLQEAMFAGVPPVVFPYGGIKRLVSNDYTGLIVHSELEYKQAIEYLYHHPEERARLGGNAREYAKQIFGAENAAKKLNPIYEKLIEFPKSDRPWGVMMGYRQVDQLISLEDVTGKAKQLSGAECFIESLGDTAPEFKVSQTSDNIEELFEADRKIANSSTLLATGEGGISQYQDYYKNDGYLMFWWGLRYQWQGKYDAALTEFIKAINLGCNHWRIGWYVAQIALKVNNIALAKQSISEVIRAVPDFAEAQELLELIELMFRSGHLSEKEEIEFTNNLRLRAVNLIIFPDWSQPEEPLLEELASVIRAIATHPDKSVMTLLIDTNNITEEEVDAAVSGVIMSLLMEEELDIEDGPDISVVTELTETEWKALLPRVHGKILMKNENKETTVRIQAENLLPYPLESLSDRRVVRGEDGAWMLR